MARHRLRLKKLINWSVQGPIVTRLLSHFAAYNAATLLLLIILQAVRTSVNAISGVQPAGPEPTLWQQAAPVTICMVLMLPFMVWDLMRLTNRVAGPLYRFEAIMAEYVKTGVLRTATLRQGDLLMDFETRFNEFAEAMHQRHPESRPAEPSSSQPAAANADESTIPFRQSV
jgi:hypothetical protein